MIILTYVKIVIRYFHQSRYYNIMSQGMYENQERFLLFIL